MSTTGLGGCSSDPGCAQEPPAPSSPLFFCAVRYRSGALACWGGKHAWRSNPPRGPFTQVQALFPGACALRVNGGLICWGLYPRSSAGPYDALEQDGCGLTGAGVLFCWGAPSPGASFVQYDARSDCGLRSDGSLACFAEALVPPAGDYQNIAGDLSALGNSPLACAAAVSGAVTCFSSFDGVTEIRSSGLPPGNYDRVAVNANDEEGVCGVTNARKLGCSATSETLSDTRAGRFTQVSVGDGFGGNVFACALRTSGAIACWGQPDNSSGDETPPPGDYTQLSDSAQCALRSDGAIVCWGTYTPGNPPPGRYLQFSDGGIDHICGVRLDHTIYCAGQTGTPAWSAGDYTEVSTGESEVVGVERDGTLDFWGWPSGVLFKRVPLAG